MSCIVCSVGNDEIDVNNLQLYINDRDGINIPDIGLMNRRSRVNTFDCPNVCVKESFASNQ